MSTDDGRDPVDHRAALAREQEALLALVTATPAALDARVPACPAWSVRDLLAHLAGVHRWAVALVRTPPHEPGPGGHGPSAAADVVHDYALAATQLRAALADPPRPCRTLDGPGTDDWWARRQLHETLVHRVDVEQALDLTSTAAEAVVRDTVAEVLDTMLPRQVRLSRAVLPSGVAVDLVAPGARWRLGESGPAAASSVTGPALVLAQLLWRRTTADDPLLHVTGDPAALRAVLAQPLTP
ncbi:maleylpyruvate isomerase family mycothiol-dependent enzyme [Kineococcus rubinsiae]|uniref:maleylpyruvate isomerase family mycothiol-dependent enzyme n=1 Tax=Kineococcus rubinsiae TaxID=2609562 RepID=UPI0014305BF1|nr:maleylpyruvate isomerase family mycothiol-dependent enzyme [Kineococcus rubinsiae]